MGIPRACACWVLCPADRRWLANTEPLAVAGNTSGKAAGKQSQNFCQPISLTQKKQKMYIDIY